MHVSCRCTELKKYLVFSILRKCLSSLLGFSILIFLVGLVLIAPAGLNDKTVLNNFAVFLFPNMSVVNVPK